MYANPNNTAIIHIKCNAMAESTETHFQLMLLSSTPILRKYQLLLAKLEDGPSGALLFE